VGALTYYGKFHHINTEPIKRHNLLGWVFKTYSNLSTLIIFPNDGNPDNNSNTGTRIFINPVLVPGRLDSNFISYQKGDLYLLGTLSPEHIKRYCTEVDENARLYYQADSNWDFLCTKAQRIRGSANPLTGDWGLPAQYTYLNGSLSLVLTHQYQKILIADSNFISSPDSSILLEIRLSPVSYAPALSRIFISPRLSAREGVSDSSLILRDAGHALAFRLEDDGRFYIKQIVLKHPME
jgi:hypothetical protein